MEGIRPLTDQDWPDIYELELGDVEDSSSLWVKKFFDDSPSIAWAVITAMLTVVPTPLSLENAEAGGVEFSFPSCSNFLPTCKQMFHGQERAKGIGD